MSLGPVSIVSEHAGVSNRRFVCHLEGGDEVEAVLYRGDTLCVSSQVGCAVRCPFCASGANGLGRGLGLDELVGQVEAVRGLPGNDRLRRVTVSGVGEPLHNPAALDAFLAWCRGEGLGMSLTTSGGPTRRLRAWLHAPHNGLTLSVHAGTEATRARLVPKGPTLGELFSVLADELPRMTGRRRRKLALAYLMVAGENDGEAEVDAFLDRVVDVGLPRTEAMVHLYAFNPVPTAPYQRVDPARYQAVYDRMSARGLRVRMSSQARVEANGGCGTLVALRRSRAPRATHLRGATDAGWARGRGAPPGPRSAGSGHSAGPPGRT